MGGGAFAWAALHDPDMRRILITGCGASAEALVERIVHSMPTCSLFG